MAGASPCARTVVLFGLGSFSLFFERKTDEKLVAPLKIYLDTHQWTNCIEPRLAGWTVAGLDFLRATMVSQVRADRIALLGSQYHLEEMSRILAQYRRPIIEFFWTVVRWNLLLPTQLLARREVEFRRTLQDNEPLDTFNNYQRVKRLSLNDTEMNALASQIAAIW